MLLWPGEKNEVKICERNRSANTKVSGEGRGEGAPEARAEVSL